MRTPFGITIHTANTAVTKASLAPEAATAAAVAAQRSPWHSPVPYLFGGLAAMLGLIAFALLILACSYWKLSSSGQNNNNDEEQRNSEDQRKDLEAGGMKVMEEKIVVMMPGQDKPTFLATPTFILTKPKAASALVGDSTHNLDAAAAADKPKDQQMSRHS